VPLSICSHAVSVAGTIAIPFTGYQHVSVSLLKYCYPTMSYPIPVVPCLPRFLPSLRTTLSHAVFLALSCDSLLLFVAQTASPFHNFSSCRLWVLQNEATDCHKQPATVFNLIRAAGFTINFIFSPSSSPGCDFHRLPS
jgi:hypothetical protein